MYKQIVVTLDESPAFLGWSNEGGGPQFERAELIKILDEFIPAPNNIPVYDEWLDIFSIAGDFLVISGKDIKTPEGIKRVYGLPGWEWERAAECEKVCFYSSGSPRFEGWRQPGKLAALFDSNQLIPVLHHYADPLMIGASCCIQDRALVMELEGHESLFPARYIETPQGPTLVWELSWNWSVIDG